MNTSTRNLAVVAICAVLVTSLVILSNQNPYFPMVSEVPFEEIGWWWISGYESRDNLTIRDEVTWETVWTEMESIQSHPADLPEIDFEREMVIAVFQGERSSSGFWTNITRIMMTNATYVVYIDEIHPEDDSGLLAVMTYPYHLVKISDVPLNLPVQFVYNIIFQYCEN